MDEIGSARAILTMEETSVNMFASAEAAPSMLAAPPDVGADGASLVPVWDAALLWDVPLKPLRRLSEAPLLPLWGDVADTRYEVVRREPVRTGYGCKELKFRNELVRCVEPPPQTLFDYMPLDESKERRGDWLLHDNFPDFRCRVRGSAPIARDPAATNMVSEDAIIFVGTCVNCSKGVLRCSPCSITAYKEQVDVLCNACLRADATCGTCLLSCATCDALSAAAVPLAAAAVSGAASIATPPRRMAGAAVSPAASALAEAAVKPQMHREEARNDLTSAGPLRPLRAASGAKRKAAEHRCIECGDASVDAAGAVCTLCELLRYAQLAKEQNGSIFAGTVHCELLDYLLTIALQRNLNLSREDIVDLALGYAEVALPRPIPATRVKDHVSAVFPLLRKYAAARAGGRPVADGEQFNPSVHKWDADATYSDWARKYEAAYSVAPPANIVAHSVLREREKV